MTSGTDLETRTVKHLVACGFVAERVAKRGRNRVADVFGCVDIIAVGPLGVELIQVTTRTNRWARKKKIQAAGLSCPVQLIYWFKDERGRWQFLSEAVPPTTPAGPFTAAPEAETSACAPEASPAALQGHGTIQAECGSRREAHETGPFDRGSSA